MNNINEQVSQAVESIQNKSDIVPSVGIILGSGLSSFVSEIENSVNISYADIPNLPSVKVKGHKGELVLGTVGGVNIAAFAGRVHYYEGYTMGDVCFSVRIMKAMGVKNLIITNAGGAVNKDLNPGDLIFISDHINLTADNPLRGSTDFIDMSEAYSKQLRTIAQETLRESGDEFKEGIYMILNGPSYETPAEVRMARNLGADIVGMSTIPEVIMARRLGINVLGISMITNMAAGILSGKLDHEEVIEIGKRSGADFVRLLRQIIPRINL